MHDLTLFHIPDSLDDFRQRLSANGQEPLREMSSISLTLKRHKNASIQPT
jgi:hypothetical protein